ncbi:PREDICTED: coiled-coil domain-containing protein 47-like isoform X1 [Branchiostoma belcheri]|uniref:PAT complex subunit CCDC47 n=1 Tax=Branchiostoma belcheri TaxID=7741 RepID=A0A6P4XRT0_BRABE|nr:PREDICTED: coiled-coil domain-containing protein 47-like isoform X1 [Branchiostoma belcheri]
MRCAVGTAWLLVLLLLPLVSTVEPQDEFAEFEDNEFAEFEHVIEDEEEEDFLSVETEDEEEEEEAGQEEVPEQVLEADFDDGEADVQVEDDEDEFEQFDDEEFEGFDSERTGRKGRSQDPPDLKITNVPYHLRTSWENFYLEILMIGGLLAYAMNYVAGKTKNHKLASAWLTAHKDLLEANFTSVGDDGQGAEVQSGILMKESEHIYSIWCSGRVCCEGMLVEIKVSITQTNMHTNTHKLTHTHIQAGSAAKGCWSRSRLVLRHTDKHTHKHAHKHTQTCTQTCTHTYTQTHKHTHTHTGSICCEGMLVEIKLLKRQDLVSVISRMMRPSSDQVTVTIDLGLSDMDSFVFAVGNKKTIGRLHKDMNDLSLFVPDKRPGEKYGLPSGMAILSESGEVTNAIIDNKMVRVLNNYADMFEFLHISDQFSGPKVKDGDPQPATKMPDTKKTIIFTFNVPGQGRSSVKDVFAMEPMMKLVFHILDKVFRFRLSKEAKTKADKMRLKVEESFLKMTHAQRQEAAQARREERRRAEKDRMMAEEDPDRQRKMEEREYRRDMKKKQPKVKQLKVKMG